MAKRGRGRPRKNPPRGIQELLFEHVSKENPLDRKLAGDEPPTPDELSEAEERARLKREDPVAFARLEQQDAMNIAIARAERDEPAAQLLERNRARLAKARRHSQRYKAALGSGQSRKARAAPMHTQWRARAQELRTEGIGASKASEIIETELIAQGRKRTAIYNVIVAEFQ